MTIDRNKLKKLYTFSKRKRNHVKIERLKTVSKAEDEDDD